jgi:hypothetical protein
MIKRQADRPAAPYFLSYVTNPYFAAICFFT